MWAAWVVAAIALAAAAFMLRFLIALLSEGAPSVCYWVVPVRREPQKEGHLEALSGICLDGSCRATESDRGDDRLGSLENENYAKEERSSGLIALDVRPVSDGLGWRSIHPRRSSVFREHRL
jgi:hypothetical protein